MTTIGVFDLKMSEKRVRCCFLLAKPRAPWVEGAASVGRSPGLQGSKVRASWGMGIISKGLGDSSFTP